MEESLDTDMVMMAADQPALVLVGLIACGILCCFFGYRTTHFLIDFSGFILFGMVAMLLAGVITEGNLLFMGLGMVAGGLIGALLAHGIYRLGIMILGGGACALIVWHFSETLPSEQWLIPAALAAGILGGLLSVVLQRFIISLATAALGGLFVVHGVFLLLLQFDIEPSLPEALGVYTDAALFGLAWSVMSGTGFIFQLFLNKDKKEK
jgi:hypothetical protein